MKITKTRLKEIIKEEVSKIMEAGLPHALRGGTTMKDLDDDAKTRETDFLKKKKKDVSDVGEEAEDLEETSAMGAGAVAGSPAGPMSPKRKPVKEQ